MPYNHISSESYSPGGEVWHTCLSAVIAKLLTELIHLKWDYHFKYGNIYLKRRFIEEVFHLVGTIHFTQLSTKITTAYVLILLPGLNDWLHPDYTISFNFPVASIAVYYIPVAPM